MISDQANDKYTGIIGIFMGFLRQRGGKAVILVCLITLFQSFILGHSCIAADQAQTKRVLIIPSYNFDYLGSIWFLQGVVRGFKEQAPFTINYFQENLQLAAHPMDEQYFTAMAESLKTKYAREKPDLIIVQYKQALEFMIRYGRQIFGDVPVVFAGAEMEDYSTIKLPAGYTGVTTSFDAKRNIDLIIRNHPAVKKIYIVAGVSSSEQDMMTSVLKQAEMHQGQVEFIALSQLSYEQMLNKIDDITDNAVIMYLAMHLDTQGKVLVPAEVAQEISRIAHVPVYGVLDTYMGKGITGGFLINHEDLGKKAAEISLEVLQGKKAAGIPVQHEPLGKYTFDGRELSHWGLDEHNLPSGSIVKFKESGIWELYKWQLIGAACLLLLQGFLIAGLLASRSKRRMTEVRLRQSEERFRKITANLPVAIACADKSSNIIFINEKFIETFGYSLEEIPTLDAWLEKTHPDEKSAEPIDGLEGGVKKLLEKLTDKPLVESVTCRNGKIKVIEFALATDGEYTYVVLNDITDRLQAEEALRQKTEEIRHLAYYDSLTSLPNRTLLNERLDGELDKARCTGSSGVVLFIDLDDLKMVNDSFGHTYGDVLIRTAGDRIVDAAGAGAFVGRIGGDEFMVMLSGKSDRKWITHIASRIIEALRQDIDALGLRFHISASAGIAVYPEDGATTEDIFKNADNAMYAAKRAGKNCWRFYQAVMQTEAYEKMLLTNSLRHAVQRGEFVLHYQPQVSVNDGIVVGFEALLRWNSPEHGSISPARFIPLAEQSGLIHPIGEWVLSEACRFARRLADRGWGHLHIAVNVSPYQLCTDGFIDSIHEVLSNANIEPHQLELEITESALMDSLEDSIRKINELQAMGVRFSLDDFGTGYSSLTYLQRLPVQTLKVDKAFIDMIVMEGNQKAVIRNIVDMAHIMGMTVIAEGVESKQQIDYLAQCRCDCLQGYVVSRPVPEEEAVRFLTRSARSELIAGIS